MLDYIYREKNILHFYPNLSIASALLSDRPAPTCGGARMMQIPKTSLIYISSFGLLFSAYVECSRMCCVAVFYWLIEIDPCFLLVDGI